MPDDFTTLAANAAAMNKREKDPCPPHWSDDPRFDSKAHYDAVMAGREALPHPNGSDFVNDIEGTDRHAAGCSHDSNGFRIL